MEEWKGGLWSWFGVFDLYLFVQSRAEQSSREHENRTSYNLRKTG